MVASAGVYFFGRWRAHALRRTGVDKGQTLRGNSAPVLCGVRYGSDNDRLSCVAANVSDVPKPDIQTRYCRSNKQFTDIGA